MEKRFVLWNPGPASVRVGDEILIQPCGYSDRIFDQDEIDFLKPEVHAKGIRVCIILPVGPDGRRTRRRRPEGPDLTVPSPRQHELYKKLTGQQLEEGIDRIEASKRIDQALAKRNAAAEHADRRATAIALVPPEGSFEILAERLYAAHAPAFPKKVAGITLIVNWTSTPVQSADDVFVLNGVEADNIDEMVLAGIVRLVAASMRGIGQKVLLYGAPDAVAVTAACVLREHLSIPAEQAVRILRRVLPAALGEKMLLETVARYRPT